MDDFDRLDDLEFDTPLAPMPMPIMIPVATEEVVRPQRPVQARRFGTDAADFAAAAPPPAGNPVQSSIPAYSLQAGGAGDGVTTRDIKAAGVGALVMAGFLWLAKHLTRTA